MQLLCRPDPCHVCICNAFPHPCTYTAHFYCTWISFLDIWFIYNSLIESKSPFFILMGNLMTNFPPSLLCIFGNKNEKKIEAVCDLIHIYNQFMHSGQSYVHNHAIMHCRSSKSGEGNLSAPPLPLRSHFLAVFLPHRQIYICTSQSVRVCKLQLFLFSSVDRRGLFTHGKMPLPPCVINWGYLKY